MTLGDGKRKVLMLIDEYSSGGTISVDADIEAKMADFFDQAQKDVAQHKRIERLFEVEREQGVTAYELPADYISLKAVWIGGKKSNNFGFKAGKIVIPENETEPVEVEYFAAPKTIDGSTPDSYVFEVAPDAAECLPYFVAAQQLIVDLVVDYGALLQLYMTKVNQLDLRGSGIRLHNTFYRGG